METPQKRKTRKYFSKGKKMEVLNKIDNSTTTPGQMTRAFRKGRGFTLKILSEVTKIPVSNLSQIENDKIELGVKRAEVLAAALGVRLLHNNKLGLGNLENFDD